MAEPTQMLILSIPTLLSIEDPASPAGRTWNEILDIVKRSAGYKRLYWGRHFEKPGIVQLHIVRSLLQTHHAFLACPEFQALLRTLDQLTASTPTIRHALISEFSSSCKSLGKGAPVTGTAIYLSTRTSSWDIAWANWVAFVQSVPGFLGIAGGPVLESVDGHERAYIALVGWESVAVHEAYHRTRHFREEGRRVLLEAAEGGYAYHGHVGFAHAEEEGGEGRLKL